MTTRPRRHRVRDYIHVVDLARGGHVAAIKKLEQKPGLFICNLGTGHGYSVLDVINAFSKALRQGDPLCHRPRRPGDIAECWCDPSKAKRELGWEASTALRKCAPTAGTGRATTRTGIRLQTKLHKRLRMPDAVTSRIGHLFFYAFPLGGRWPRPRPRPDEGRVCHSCP